MDTPAKPAARPSLKARFDELLRVYGPIAFVTYLALFAATLAGFVIAIRMGVAVEGATAGAGTLLAAWLATKATQPVRILATLALTPLFGRLLRRRQP